MPSQKREGAILYPAEKRVRLRHEPPGFVYELRESVDGVYFDVFHVDTVLMVTSAVGRILRRPGKLAIEKTGRVALDDALRLVARAWSRLPYLKARS